MRDSKHPALALIAAMCVFSPTVSWAQLIPEARTVDWQSIVGVKGGIPNRTNIRNCVTEDGAHADSTDTAAQIQACIDATPEDGVAYLPQGTYRIHSGLLLGNRMTLRGAGPEATIILVPSGVSVGVLVEFSPSQGFGGATVNIDGSVSKGDDQLLLESASAIDVGDYLWVDEQNDASVPVTSQGYGNCTWCGRGGDESRLRGQMVEVMAKTGNTIIIEPSMFFDFADERDPEVMKLTGPLPSGMGREYTGIEDLQLKNTYLGSTPTSSSFKNIQVRNTANSWIKNIHIENCGRRCIELNANNTRIEIRDSRINGCMSHRFDSNDCYGTLVGSSNSGILIENNIYSRISSGPMFGWGNSGNVVAYNYVYDVYRREVEKWKTWFTAINLSIHAAHASFVLWEGNESETIYFDQYWGSSSHNTVFRNRVLGQYADPQVQAQTSAGINNILAFANEQNITHTNVVGNVMGTAGYHQTYEQVGPDCPGGNKPIYRTGRRSSGTCDYLANAFDTMFRHNNFDYVTNGVKQCGQAGEPGCQGSNGSMNLPSSYYLASKPSFFGSLPWPATGPDLSPVSSSIPAKNRFMNIDDPNPATCGDGTCNSDETCSTCTDDCGECPPAVCGDDVCDAVEDCDSCPSDCGTCAPACNDGICDAVEDCASCPSDCGACAPTCDPATGEGCVLQGLVAHWEFDEGEGTSAADSSGNAHTGDLHDSSWSSGVWGWAGQFDGTASYVDVSSVKPHGENLTVALWMRADSFAVADGRLISKATGVQTAQHDFMLSTASAGGGIKSRARLQTSSAATTLIGSGPDLELDTWTHLALVYNGSELKLYQDGAEVGSTPMSGTITDTAPLTWIGRNPVGGRAFAGAIDDVRMYDTALSAAQIEALINGTDSPPECFANSDCDDAEECTADSCDAGMCSSVIIPDCGRPDDPMPDGTCEIDEDCQDGDSCTYDVCNEGRCISAVISDCAEEGPIVVGCQQVGGGAWPGLLLVLAVAFWRRRRSLRSSTEA